MSHEDTPNDAIRAQNEIDRAADFKHERSGLVEAVKGLAEGMYLGRSKTQGNFSGGPLSKGGLRFDILTTPTGGHSPARRTVVFHENEYKQYEEGEGKTYGPHGAADLIVHFTEESFDEATKDWIRKGWEVYGDGSVNRLSYGADSKGNRVDVAMSTNDVLDLMEANEYLQEVTTETLTPEQPA